METINMELPKKEMLLSQANPILEMANALVIDDDNMFVIAGEELKPIKGHWNKMEEMRVSLVKPLNDHVSLINGLFKDPMAIYKKAEDIIKEKQRGWVRIKDERAAALKREQDRLDAIAREEARKEEQRLLDEAAEQAAAGNTEMAAQIEQEAAQVAATPVMSAPVAEVKTELKGGGTSIARPWKAEELDHIAFIKFVAANPQYSELLKTDLSALQKMAKAMKDNMRFDGIRVYQDVQLSQR